MERALPVRAALVILQDTGVEKLVARDAANDHQKIDLVGRQCQLVASSRALVRPQKAPPAKLQEHLAEEKIRDALAFRNLAGARELPWRLHRQVSEGPNRVSGRAREQHH